MGIEPTTSLIMRTTSSAKGIQLSLLAGCFSLAHACDSPVTVSMPNRVPDGASLYIPHDFASFSFPAHWFADFCGNHTHPNLFSRDIFNLLASKTGAAPFIRVGGASTDRVWYNETQEEAVIRWYSPNATFTTEYGIPDELLVGPSFFDGFDNFPGTHWSWQVNMGNSFGKPGGLDNAMQVAQMVVDKVQDRLESFELGNEPDLMWRFEHRLPNYTLPQYIEEWNDYAAATSERVLKGNPYGLEEVRFFQGMTSAYNGKDWSLNEALRLGLDRDGYLKAIAWHQYAGRNDPWVRLQNSYMNHTANAANISQYHDMIETCRTHDPPLPFVLGETNSNSYNLNMAHVIGVFGSALWLIDHLLLGMAANITRYNLIQGTTFGYTGWVPVSLDGRDPYVRPPLYGQIFAADALGLHDEVQIKTVEGLPWNMSAYGIYEAGELARYAVVNYDEWNATTPYERPSLAVDLRVPCWVDHVEVRRLTGAGASADEGIQWAGQSWNYTDGRLVEKGTRQVEMHKVTTRGRLSLELESTSAVLVDLFHE